MVKSVSSSCMSSIGIRSETKWVKVGSISDICFVGKDCICFGSGCHLIFIDLNTKQRYTYTANTSNNGDGISCFTGSTYMNVFAFAESCANPSLIVAHFPSFEKKLVLEGQALEGYLAIAFSQSHILIALTNLPHFHLIIWDWVSGEKLASKETDLVDVNQELRCSYTKPIYLAQWGKTMNTINLWYVFMCGKRCVMTRHRIKPATDPTKYELGELKVTSLTWNTDNHALMLADNFANIYILNSENLMEKVIDGDIRGPLEMCICFHKSGFVASGPDYMLRYYVKSTNWYCDWEVTMDANDPLVKLWSNRGDYLIGLSEKGNLVEICQTGSTIIPVVADESGFNTFCMIYPVGKYFAALCHDRNLLVYETSNGNVVSKKVLRNNATDMASNPELPYVAVTYDNGILELISLYIPQKIMSIALFHLTRNSLNSIYFSEHGTVVVVANTTIGEFFIIEGVPGTHMKVLASVSANLQVADYVIAASKTCYRLFILPVTSDTYLAGNKIIRYCVMKHRSTNMKEYQFENSDILFHKLHGTSNSDRDKTFYAIPLNHKYICKIEANRGSDFVKITEKLQTGHQLAKFQLFIDKYHGLTWSHDGVIFIRNPALNNLIEVITYHHRSKFGVKKAYVSPSGRYVISLGNDNLLTCTLLLQIKEEQHIMPMYERMFERSTLGFMPTGPLKGKTWLEVEELGRTEMERIRCQNKKKNIIHEFENIRELLRKLLTENLEGPDNEKLDMLEFNLDKKLYRQKVERNKELCKNTDIYLRQLINAHHKVTDYLKHIFWNTMEIPGKSIFAIYSNCEVSNYVILPQKNEKTSKLEWHMEKRHFYKNISVNGTFRPWRIYSELVLQEIATKPMMAEATSHMKMFATISTMVMDENVKTSEYSETSVAIAGSIAQTLIEPFSARVSQRAIHSFCQYEVQCCIIEDETERLRIFFNQEFNNVMDRKMKEVGVIKTKNARLRHIISEINYFSENKINIIVFDPEWRQEENPEQLIKVENNEVSILPYISPSEQAILDAEAAEAERIRLLLLADDFRERALMAMMNGVLEVRWEDELKKEVPLPKCMLEKDPANFNEEDLRALKDYEEKVKFLNSERERYKHLLHAEYAKVSSQVRENTRKFNKSLAELLLLKVTVQSAIDQEYFIMNRIKLRLLRGLQFEKLEAEIMNLVMLNEQVIQRMQDNITSLHSSVTECRQFVDILMNREKLMEKTFRRDFIDYPSVVQEQCMKLYKKRPKINIRSMSVPRVVLFDLARAIMTREQSLLLAPECVEFLKALEVLDQQIGLPSIIDENTFALVCKHRRMRIEHDIKIRCALVTATEAEQTMSLLQKSLVLKKEENIRNTNKLNEIRVNRLYLFKNIDVQLVMRHGTVELPISGDVKDFDDAVLVSHGDVLTINKFIVDAGEKKLKSLRQALNFKRRIIAMEWEHKKMKMYISDLEEQIRDIEDTTVTKEMQSYLKSKARGIAADTTLSFETEIEMLKVSYENIIKEHKEQVSKMQKQIRALQERNSELDKKIADVNVDVCEFNLEFDHEFEEKEKHIYQTRMTGLIKRHKLIQKIQRNHNEILVLQTELELFRLKTYPTLKYKICY